MAAKQKKAASSGKPQPRTFKKSTKGKTKRSVDFRRSTGKKRPPKRTQARKARRSSVRAAA